MDKKEKPLQLKYIQLTLPNLRALVNMASPDCSCGKALRLMLEYSEGLNRGETVNPKCDDSVAQTAFELFLLQDVTKSYESLQKCRKAGLESVKARNKKRDN